MEESLEHSQKSCPQAKQPLEKTGDSQALAMLICPEVPRGFDTEVNSLGRSKQPKAPSEQTSVAQGNHDYERFQEQEDYLRDLGSFAEKTAGGPIGLVTSSGLYGQKPVQEQLANFRCSGFGDQKEACIEHLLEKQKHYTEAGATAMSPVPLLAPQQCAIDMKNVPLNEPEYRTDRYYNESIYVPSHEGAHCNPNNQRVSQAEEQQLGAEGKETFAETHAAVAGYLAVALQAEADGDYKGAKKYLEKMAKTPDYDWVHRFDNEAAKAVSQIPQERIREMSKWSINEINRESYSMARKLSFPDKETIK